MIVETFKTESEWLKARRGGVGSSDAAIIYGLPGYRSIRRIYADKRGESWGVINNKPTDLNEMGEAGHRFEEANSRWFADKTGKKVTDPGEYTLHWASGNPPMFCTPDRFVENTFGKRIAVLELKLAFHRQAKIWSHMVPTAYMIQMQHQMLCCELDTAFISVILNGYQHRWFEVKRHERTIKELKRRVEWFMEHVRAGTPPPVCNSSDMMQTLQDQYSQPEETRVDLPYKFWQITEEIDKATKQKSELEKKIKHNKNLIREAIGTATTGVLIDGTTAWHWKKTKTGRTLKKGVIYDG